MTNRMFGIEIEFKGSESQRDKVAAYMNQHGVDCTVERYNHTTRRHWKITTDASAQWELVSPPMSGEDAKRQIKIVCEAFAAARVKIDKSCGLHIHHDASDFTVETFKKLFAMYVRFEDALDTLMPASRRDDSNQYCRGFKYNQQQTLDSLRNCHTVQDLMSTFSTRYIKLNCQSYQRHGTIEFRHHSGTVEFDRIWNWYVLTQTMVETAVSSKVTIPKQASKMSQKWFDFKKVIKSYAWMGASEELQGAIEFYNKRRQELAKAMGIELAA